MIYSNMGVYKYGESVSLVEFENIKDTSKLIGVRKNAIKLDNSFKTPDIIYKLIILFHESYYNTDIDTLAFGEEFYNVVYNLTNGVIPLELKFLSVNEILDDIEDILKGEV